MSRAGETKAEPKELIMLEIEPIARDDRAKRSSDGTGMKYVRQAPPIPQDYLSLLQQFSAQQQQQAGGNQPPVHQLLVARDGKQPAAARYVLTQDGRIAPEDINQVQAQQQLFQQANYNTVNIPNTVQPTGMCIFKDE